jgi:acetate kinase
LGVGLRTTAVRVLVVNAGSSSLKLRVLESDDRVSASADLIVPPDHDVPPGLERTLRGLGAVDAIGHRIVHGASEFHGAVRIDPTVEWKMAALADLAPLHQPLAVRIQAAVASIWPDTPAVACFDTAFHATMPEAAFTYPVPAEWRTLWSLRRYGFHGLSHAYASRRVGAMLNGRASARIVTCHLGAGASLAAVQDGRSIDTTMGFTPLDGLVMATRSGSLDPGLLLWLEEHAHVAPLVLARALGHRSGLLALAGTADMKTILARRDAGDHDATLAVDVYVHRLRAEIAAMAAAMNGLDALVFTGGVGEHAPALRQLAADGLGFLGVALDPARNAGGPVDREIGRNGAPVAAFVVEAREDLEIARQVRDVMRRDLDPAPAGE